MKLIPYIIVFLAILSCSETQNTESNDPAKNRSLELYLLQYMDHLENQNLNGLSEQPIILNFGGTKKNELSISTSKYLPLIIDSSMCYLYSKKIRNHEVYIIDKKIKPRGESVYGSIKGLKELDCIMSDSILTPYTDYIFSDSEWMFKYKGARLSRIIDVK